MREIISNGTVLARFVDGDNWAPNLSFFSEDDDFVQVGTWVYESGKKLAAHRHNIYPRASNRTQEVIFVRKGSLISRIYDETGILVETITMKTGDLMILLAGGHGYDVVEDDTQVLEVKNGPYAGAEKDRIRF